MAYGPMGLWAYGLWAYGLWAYGLWAYGHMGIWPMGPWLMAYGIWPQASCYMLAGRLGVGSSHRPCPEDPSLLPGPGPLGPVRPGATSSHHGLQASVPIIPHSPFPPTGIQAEPSWLIVLIHLYLCLFPLLGGSCHLHLGRVRRGSHELEAGRHALGYKRQEALG